MKRAICFFSGTGNTCHVAWKIQERFPDSSLFFIPETDPAVLAGFDEITVCSPTHIFGLPEIVRKFVLRWNFPGAPRVNLVMTAGGSPALSMPLMRQALRRTGKTLAYFAWIRMPDNYLILYRVTPEDKKALADSPARIEAILSDLERGVVQEFRPRFFGFLKGLQKLAARSARLTSRFYRVKGCVRCGKCVAACPTANIVLGKAGPEFGNRCTGCLGCLNLCPVEAIEFGSLTRGKERYVHPGVDLTTRRPRP